MYTFEWIIWKHVYFDANIRRGIIISQEKKLFCGYSEYCPFDMNSMHWTNLWIFFFFFSLETFTTETYWNGNLQTVLLNIWFSVASQVNVNYSISFKNGIESITNFNWQMNYRIFYWLHNGKDISLWWKYGFGTHFFSRFRLETLFRCISLGVNVKIPHDKRGFCLLSSIFMPIKIEAPHSVRCTDDTKERNEKRNNVENMNVFFALSLSHPHSHSLTLSLSFSLSKQTCTV